MYKDFESIQSCSRNDSGSRCGRVGSCLDMNGTCISENMERRSWGLENYPLASVYAPLQNFDDLYDKETALEKGTVFAELDIPFMGESVYKGGGCRG